MTPLDNLYLQYNEPVKSCLLALMKIVLKQDENIKTSISYGMPFFYYKNKRFCYLWVHKKMNQPYLGIIDGQLFNHPQLIAEKRSRMKIMLFDPNEDLPVEIITAILQQVINFYKTGQKK